MPYRRISISRNRRDLEGQCADRRRRRSRSVVAQNLKRDFFRGDNIPGVGLILADLYAMPPNIETPRTGRWDFDLENVGGPILKNRFRQTVENGTSADFDHFAREF